MNDYVKDKISNSKISFTDLLRRFVSPEPCDHSKYEYRKIKFKILKGEDGDGREFAVLRDEMFNDGWSLEKDSEFDKIDHIIDMEALAPMKNAIV